MPQFNVKELIEKLNALGVRPNKKLGQNFLVNVSVCEKIVHKALSFNPSQILEVGPGLGALTEIAAKSNCPIKLIELDRSFAEYWKSKEFEVFHEDALQLDWNKLKLPKQTCLLSNLPYQISSSLVIDRSVDPFNVETMVLMFQKEVAQRIMAKHKTENYGLLTVIAQSFWDIENLCEISSKDFYPPPQVASRVLVFKRRIEVPPNPKKFLTFVKTAFAQRRKFMITNLSALKAKQELEVAFKDCALKETTRAEELSISDFLKLWNRIQN